MDTDYMESLLNGHWVTIETQEEFDMTLQSEETPRKAGKFRGPGNYVVVKYFVPCGRGCCMDEVCGLIPYDEAMENMQEIKDRIEEFEGRGKETNRSLIEEIACRTKRQKELEEAQKKTWEVEKEKAQKAMYERLKEKYEK